MLIGAMGAIYLQAVNTEVPALLVAWSYSFKASPVSNEVNLSEVSR
jgi:hypothetical protein